VKRVIAGASASFSLKLPHGDKLKKADIRKGMALVSKSADNKRGLASWEFEAEVVILHHATTIKVGYEPIVHAKCVRQAAKIIKMSQDLIRTGDSAVCTFRFMSRPEFVEEGTTVLFREGRTKGIGRIVGVRRMGECEEI
jgi:GTPase